MPQHEYTPDEALRAILDRVAKAAPELHDEIVEAIDAGVVGEGSSGKKKYYESRQLTDEESLAAALKVLGSYFVELPSCIASANEEICSTEIGSVQETLFSDSEQEDYDERWLEIEQVTQTTRTADAGQRQAVALGGFIEDAITEQQANFDRLSELLDFEDE